MATGKITKRSVDALEPAGRDEFLWDSELAGFGLKCTAGGRKVYLVQYRPGGRGTATRRLTIGEHGKLTPDQARDAARKVLADVELGGDPAANKARARRAPTIAELADLYLAEHVAAHNKPSTAAEIKRIVETRIKPEFGKTKVEKVTRSQVKGWHQGMQGTPYEANRSLAYFSKMMGLAAKDWELRPDNPCIGIKRFPERRRERFFDDAELQRLGAALATAERDNTAMPGCILAVRLLAMTGMRLGEVLGLEWAWVDIEAGCLRLPDAKAGARTVPLGAPTLALLSGLVQHGRFVVFGPNPEAPLAESTFRNFWDRLRCDAGIPGSRPHDLRHTTGTYAAQAGLNAFMVRDMLGHKTLAMTGRYVERANDPLRAAADTVSGRIAAAMAPKEGLGSVVRLRKA